MYFWVEMWFGNMPPARLCSLYCFIVVVVVVGIQYVSLVDEFVPDETARYSAIGERTRNMA